MNPASTSSIKEPHNPWFPTEEAWSAAVNSLRDKCIFKPRDIDVSDVIKESFTPPEIRHLLMHHCLGNYGVFEFDADVKRANDYCISVKRGMFVSKFVRDPVHYNYNYDLDDDREFLRDTISNSAVFVSFLETGCTEVLSDYQFECLKNEESLS
jgi:hypothetical protein